MDQLSRRRVSAARISGECHGHRRHTLSPRLLRRRGTVPLSVRRADGPRRGAGGLARVTTLSSWDLSIPDTDGFYVGETDIGGTKSRVNGDGQFATGSDTLDARGRRTLHVVLPAITKGRAARRRREHGGHRRQPADGTGQHGHARASRRFLYRGQAARARATSGRRACRNGRSHRRTADRRARARRALQARSCGANGIRCAAIATATPSSSAIGCRIPSRRCAVMTAAAPARCAFTPSGGGTYTVTFTATDAKGRAVSTSLRSLGHREPTGSRGTTRPSSRWTSSPTRRATPSVTLPRCFSLRHSQTLKPGLRWNARGSSTNGACTSRPVRRRSSSRSRKHSPPTRSSRSWWRAGGVPGQDRSKIPAGRPFASAMRISA